MRPTYPLRKKLEREEYDCEPDQVTAAHLFLEWFGEYPSGVLAELPDATRKKTPAVPAMEAWMLLLPLFLLLTRLSLFPGPARCPRALACSAALGVLTLQAIFGPKCC